MAHNRRDDPFGRGDRHVRGCRVVVAILADAGPKPRALVTASADLAQLLLDHVQTLADCAIYRPGFFRSDFP